MVHNIQFILTKFFLVFTFKPTVLWLECKE